MTNALSIDAMDRKRIATARFSVAGAVALAATKLVVGILSGSLGILSSALDNVADVFMSVVNYLSIRKSMEPADTNHPYGHGKVETLGTVVEGGVILLIGAWVVWEGVRRLKAGVVPRSVDAGLAVMLLSVAASWFISERIRRAGEETDSSALKADSLHFRTDVYSGAGIFLSLLLYRWTDWKWLDAALGVAVGFYIAGAALFLLREAAQDLADRGLPEETVERVRRIIDEHRPMVVDFHDLRTRRSGSEKHVDFHVVVCRRHLLEEAHKVADHLEKEVAHALGKAHVVTHIDPCRIDCPGTDQCARVGEMIRQLEDPPEQDGAGVSVATEPRESR